MSKQEHMDYFVRSGDFVQTASFPNLEINNDALMVINYLFCEKPNGTMDKRNFIWLKQANRIIHAKKIINDLTQFPNEIEISNSHKYDIYCYPWYKDNLVSIVSPGIEFKLDTTMYVDKIGEIKSSDNPIILFMKLKNP